MPENKRFTFNVKPIDSDKRLDLLISLNILNLSRSYAAELIRQGNIKVNNLVKKPGYYVKVGETIDGIIPLPEPVSLIPEPVEIEILYEDKNLIVINKAPGLVVHPSPGHLSNTLVNGILFHCPDIEGIAGDLRPGIVHRLDKDTSGTLVIAKDSNTLSNLAQQFKSRNVQKIYLAIVHGKMEQTFGKITFPIGRHPIDRKKMSIISKRGRTAETHWRLSESFTKASLLEVRLATGRTHQIRVHCKAIGHPIIGDEVYGKSNKELFHKREENNSSLIKRQMLHSWQLSFMHPAKGEFMSFESKIPEDMQKVLEKLRDDLY